MGLLMYYAGYSVVMIILSNIYFKAWCSGYNAGKEDYER